MKYLVSVDWRHGKLGIANGVIGLYPAAGSITFKGKELKLGDTKAYLRTE